jgi:hypothetical protein
MVFTAAWIEFALTGSGPLSWRTASAAGRDGLSGSEGGDGLDVDPSLLRSALFLALFLLVARARK